MADQNLNRLIVSLEARVDRYEKSLAKAQATTKRSFGAMEARARSFNGVLAAVGVGFSLQAAQKLIDASTRIGNALKVAGLSGSELTRVYDSLFASAQRNAAPVEALVELYGRASQVQKELGVSTSELLGFTDKVAVALRVSGKSAAESSGALLQLSQALGSGTVRAEEFNSILEGALPIAQAAAAGLKEAGGSVAKLRTLVVDGKVSSEAFFRSFEAGAYILEDKVANASLTVEQGFTRFSNVLVDTAGKFDNATGLSRALGGALNELATMVGHVGTAFEDAASGPIGNFFAQMGDGFASLEKWKEDFRAAVGLSGPGSLDDFLAGTNLLKGEIGFKSQQDAIAAVVPQGPQGRGRRAASAAESAVPTTVSLSDFKAPNGTRDAATKAVEKQRKAVLDLIDGLEFEKSLIGQTALEQEIQNTLREAGTTATDAQKDAIRRVITEIDGERKAIEANSEAMQEFADLSRAALGGFVDDLLAGKSAAESLGGVLSKIGSSFLNKGIDLLVGSVFPGFAEGGFTGAGGKYAPAGIVHAGEFVFDAASVKRIGVPNLERIRGFASGGFVGHAPALPPGSDHSGGGGIVVNFSTTINGASAMNRRDLDVAMREAENRFESKLPKMLNEARKRGKM